MIKRKKSKSGLIIFIIFVVYFTYTVFIQQQMLQARSSEFKQAKTKIEEQQAIKEDLERQQKLLNTDAYIEKVAREKLGLVKEGERIFTDINQ